MVEPLSVRCWEEEEDVARKKTYHASPDIIDIVSLYAAGRDSKGCVVVVMSGDCVCAGWLRGFLLSC